MCAHYKTFVVSSLAICCSEFEISAKKGHLCYGIFRIDRMVYVHASQVSGSTIAICLRLLVGD